MSDTSYFEHLEVLANMGQKLLNISTSDTHENKSHKMALIW